MVNEIKDKVKKEYYKRVKKVMETKLNKGNVFKAIISWAVSVVRYSVECLGEIVDIQLQEIDRKTRKLLTMHNGFRSKSSIDLLYLSGSEDGWGLIRVKDTVEAAILGLRFLVLIAAYTIADNEDGETPNEYKHRK